jgi:hypothetical protein
MLGINGRSEIFHCSDFDTNHQPFVTLDYGQCANRRTRRCRTFVNSSVGRERIALVPAHA